MVIQNTLRRSNAVTLAGRDIDLAAFPQSGHLVDLSAEEALEATSMVQDLLRRGMRLILSSLKPAAPLPVVQDLGTVALVPDAGELGAVETPVEPRRFKKTKMRDAGVEE